LYKEEDVVVAKQVVAMYDENYGSIVAFVDSGVENIVTTFLLEVGLVLKPQGHVILWLCVCFRHRCAINKEGILC